MFSHRNLDNFLSTVILKPSLDGFEFRFHTKLVKAYRSVSKGIGSLLKAIKRSQSRLENGILVFESHVNFTSHAQGLPRQIFLFFLRAVPRKVA